MRGAANQYNPAQPAAPDQAMNTDSNPSFGPIEAADTRPLLIVPYNWIGDFVRGHTVVRVARQRWPNRPVDILTTPLCAPLVDYMPGVRRAIVHDLPRSRLTPDRQWRLADDDHHDARRQTVLCRDLFAEIRQMRTAWLAAGSRIGAKKMAGQTPGTAGLW